MSRIMKGTISLVMAVLIVISSGSSIFAAKVTRPDITAAGAMVYCQNTGEIVYSKNSQKKLEPFSVTKLMTVLLAVQNLPLDKEVTVSAEAASQRESSINLKEGEVLTVEDLIYGALLPSGNDAAYALGEAVSGDMETFVSLMNKTAKNIGCKRTHFTNPSGMQAKRHYTTASDMMEIIKVALSNDIIRKAAGSTKYTIEKTNKSKKRVLHTHINFLKDNDSGVYAGKTGYWDDYNCSIALGYKKDGLSLFIIVLGDTVKQRTKDVKKLIQYATAKVEGYKVIGSGKENGNVRIKHGAKTSVTAYTAETGYAYLPKEASTKLVTTKTVMRSDVEAPVKAGTVVGTYQIYVADELVNEVDLVITEDIEQGWFPSYLGISNFATIIICVVVVLLLTLFLSIAIAKARYKRRKKMLKKQRIMEIAMEEMRREQERKERDWRF